MTVTASFLAYVLEQLGQVPGLRSRRMFGGVGLYGDDLFFGLVDDDVLYLRVDDANRREHVARGCRPFRPFRDRPELSMSYYDVPADVLEDVDELARWARRSMQVAAAAPAARLPPVASGASRGRTSMRFGRAAATTVRRTRSRNAREPTR
jgi:DNA transformation protein